MLRDSAHIQEMEAEWRNRKGKRSGKEADRSSLHRQGCRGKLSNIFSRSDTMRSLSPAEGIKVRFRDAGHILGSAIIEIWSGEGESERKLVFSGDLGSPNQPIVRDPSWIEDSDVLWLESTYGDRLHKSREETVQELLQIIQQAIRDQAKVVIPAFAVERTQDVIYTLHQFIRKGLIPSIPVYIDSPLAISATEIFKRNSDCFDQETKRPLVERRQPLGSSPAHLYPDHRGIEGHQRRFETGDHHLGQWDVQFRKNPPSSQTPSLAEEFSISSSSVFRQRKRLEEGWSTEQRRSRSLGEEIAVKAHIHTLGGFSAHADRKGLLDWLSHFKSPDLEVIVNHGEEKTSLGFAELIRQRLHLKATVPQSREKRTLFGSERLETPQADAPAREREESLPRLRNPSLSSSGIWIGIIRSFVIESEGSSLQTKPFRIPTG